MFRSKHHCLLFYCVLFLVNLPCLLGEQSADNTTIVKQNNESQANDSVVWIPVSRNRISQVLRRRAEKDLLISQSDNSSSAIRVSKIFSWPIELLMSLVKALPSSIKNSRITIKDSVKKLISKIPSDKSTSTLQKFKLKD